MSFFVPILVLARRTKVSPLPGSGTSKSEGGEKREPLMESIRSNAPLARHCRLFFLSTPTSFLTSPSTGRLLLRPGRRRLLLRAGTPDEAPPSPHGPRSGAPVRPPQPDGLLPAAARFVERHGRVPLERLHFLFGEGRARRVRSQERVLVVASSAVSW